MKKVLFTLFVMAISCMSLVAQNKNSAKQEKSVEVLAQERVESMQKELALTDAQCDELVPVYVKFYTESQKISKDPQSKDKMQALRNEANGEVVKRLNEVQLLKFQEKQKKMSQRGANRKENKGDENKGAKKKNQ